MAFFYLAMVICAFICAHLAVNAQEYKVEKRWGHATTGFLLVAVGVGIAQFFLS